MGSAEPTQALVQAAEARAWAALREVMDPEVPVISLVDLGVVRAVHCKGGREAGLEGSAEGGTEGGTELVLTPTYSGCPATEVIAEQARAALEAAGLGPVRVTQQLAPAWTTDWISDAGREALRRYGIAPPGRCGDAASPVRLLVRSVPCPRCGSAEVERLSAFGSTACKALYRCCACREPFEHFKPI
jgi:ring-1,2-phenylacetyl-CoA epoxidase subunit PaaD